MTVKELKRTFFYPVNLDRKTIVNDPHRTERRLAWKYRGLPVIGLKGSRLQSHRCYEVYSIIDKGN